MIKKRNAAPPEAISVLLAEDHTVVRQGLRALLEMEGDIKVVGEAENGRRAVELARKIKPRVVVMDIVMPKLNGLEAARQILRELPSTRMILLSAHSEDAYIEQAGQLDITGYLIKQTSLEDLSGLIRKKTGETLFSPAVARRLRNGNRKRHSFRGPIKKVPLLSSREVEVLQLIAEGRSNKQVAADLGISVKTVEKHRQNLMGKLNIHDTAGLTRYAISKGVIESGVQAVGF